MGSKFDALHRRGITVGGNATDNIFNTGDLTVIVSNDSELVRENIVLEARVSNLSSDLSRRIEKELEDYRESFREGKMVQGFEGIQGLRKLNTWSDLDKSLQASILRAEASTTVGRFGKEQIGIAKELAEEAAKLDSDFDDRALRLNIECIENGYGSIKDLTNFKSIETYNIWLATLLNTRRFEEVTKLCSQSPQHIKLNAESHRFYALAFLATRQIDPALEEIEKAKLEKPAWLLVRYTGAIIDYYSALSPQGLTGGLSQHPQTISLGLVRSDDASQKLLKKARLEFNEISAIYPDESRERNEAKIWEFACLANTLNIHPAENGTGKTMARKMKSAGIPTETIQIAHELRRRYRQEVRLPSYLRLSDRTRVEGATLSQIHRLKAALDAGELVMSGTEFHSKCLQSLEGLSQRFGNLDPVASETFIQGFMYSVVDRCSHRFQRAA